MRLLISENNPTHSHQTGLSLVELLIAMAISVTLLAGITQIVLSNKDTYNFQQSQSINQENSRFAYYFVDQVLEKAGYIQAPQNTRDAIFPSIAATSQCALFKAGQVISNSLEGTGLCIRFQRAESADTDCQGNAIASDNAIVTRLFFDATNNSLRCGAQGAAAVELVDNIENVVFSYGISNDADGIGRSADAYLTTPTEWEKIIAVQMAVLTSSEAESNDTPQQYRFPLSASTKTTASDKKVYRSSLKTVSLRNTVL